MAIAEELHGFVREGLGRGMPRAQLEEVLRRAGWSADDVRAALGAFADVDFPIPVPRPHPYLTAREAFRYLVFFSTLYISAYSTGALLFALIDLGLPDPAAQPRATVVARDVIRWSVSALVVALPVFLYVASRIGRDVRADPRMRDSRVRKWLTYGTLFIAGGVIIGNVTTLVYNLLGGDTTLRFLLKVLVIGAIAGAIFGWFLRDLRREEQEIPPAS